MWRKGTLQHYWWECKFVQSCWRTVQRFLKLKIELPYDPAIPLLGIYWEKTTIQKNTCTPVFIAALFTVARTRPSIHKWTKKVRNMYTTEYYSAIKMNEIFPFALTSMNLGNIVLSEVIWTEKGKYYIINDITQMWNLKK